MLPIVVCLVVGLIFGVGFYFGDQEAKRVGRADKKSKPVDIAENTKSKGGLVSFHSGALGRHCPECLLVFEGDTSYARHLAERHK